MPTIFDRINNVRKTTYNTEEIFEEASRESVETRRALREIRKAKNAKTIEEQAKELKNRFKKETALYEAYSLSDFEMKVRVDSLFYEHVLSELPEGTTGLEEAISSLYRDLRKIYEHINIKPECHRMLKPSVINESADERKETFKKILNEHMNNNYYRYTLDQRKDKYLSEATPYAEKLINEGVDSDTAIGLSVKGVILESLIRNIAMPRIIQKRVQYLCEDKDYGKVFDQESLKNLWESFNFKCKSMSKIFAIAI